MGAVVSHADRYALNQRALIIGKPIVKPALRKGSHFLLPSLYAERGIVSMLDVVINMTQSIDFAGYLTSLCDGFREQEDERHKGIGLTCTATPLMLGLETSMTLGLIVSELLSNSYQHAFPENKGKITVSLVLENSSKDARITLADDGSGIENCVKGDRRGIGLVHRLMEQVEGLAEVYSDQGTRWDLKFHIPAKTSVHDISSTASRRMVKSWTGRRRGG